MMMAGTDQGQVDGRGSSVIFHPQPERHIDHARVAAMELLTLSAVPATLDALIKLGIFDALSRAGDGAKLTAQELATQARPGELTNVSNLERLLRMMSSRDVFSETVTFKVDGRAERRYGLQEVAKFFVNDEVGGVSLAPVVHMVRNKVFMATWDHLHESVVDGSAPPFTKAHTMDAWVYGQSHADFDKLFNLGMAHHSKVYMHAVLDAYNAGFEGVKVLVDVGGGFGSSLSLITARYPHIQGINFDQPHVIAASPQLPGVKHICGNFFESVPSGDAIFMKWILHDWDDKSNLTLLKNCHKALPAKGKVIVLDSLLPEIINLNGSHRMAFIEDVNMLAYNSSGARERTELEFRDLGMAVGFAEVVVVVTVDDFAVIEMRKASCGV